MKKTIIFSSIFCVCAALYAFKTTKTPSKPNGQKTMETTHTKTKTPSGLEYQILKAGDSTATPRPGGIVEVHYSGWLNSNGEPGKKFDSSVDRGQTFSFTIGVGHVIRGWDEGVMGMKVGEKRRLYIPAALGYGARGAGAVIPPNADLIFDVELINVSK